MRVRMLVVVALAAAAAPLPPAVAAEGPVGAGCRFDNDTGTKIPEDESQTGRLYGGPYLGTGTLTCSIQNDSTLHSGTDLAAASASGEDVVVLSPTRVWYQSPDHIRITVCTSFTPAGGPTLYRVPGGAWSEDPETPCAAPEPFDRVDLWETGETVDAVLCPVLVTAAPTLSGLGVDVEPDGDVAGLWDCPPYGD